MLFPPNLLRTIPPPLRVAVSASLPSIQMTNSPLWKLCTHFTTRLAMSPVGAIDGVEWGVGVCEGRGVCVGCKGIGVGVGETIGSWGAPELIQYHTPASAHSRTTLIVARRIPCGIRRKGLNSTGSGRWTSVAGACAAKFELGAITVPDLLPAAEADNGPCVIPTGSLVIFANAASPQAVVVGAE